MVKNNIRFLIFVSRLFDFSQLTSRCVLPVSECPKISRDLAGFRTGAGTLITFIQEQGVKTKERVVETELERIYFELKPIN